MCWMPTTYFWRRIKKAFLNLKETLDPTVSVVMAPYHTGFDERGRVTFSYYRERLIKNRLGCAG